jgi:2-methylcitrate dehydratase PrpD
MVDRAFQDTQLAERDTIYILAGHFINTHADNLTEEVIEATKWYICDCLGVAIAGSSSVGCPEVVDQVVEWGGRPEATILAYGNKVPAVLAAFANATMSRALDLDDVYEEAIVHVTASVLPAALAMAEKTGQVSGRELITTVALGRDLICRMALANLNVDGERGRSMSYQFNTFASAAVTGRYLELDLDQIVAAFGLAYGQGLSNRQGVIDGTMSVRVHQGFTAHLGVMAAHLARRDVTAARHVIDGKYGYYNLYEEGRYDPSRLTDGLGQDFKGIDSSIKTYPCCKKSHTAVQATVDLVQQLGAAPDEIAEIDVGMNLDGYYTVCDPPGRRYDPETVVDAQFSAPWVVAVAAIRGTFFIEDLTEEGLRNKAARALVQRVKCRVDDAINKETAGQITPARVRITLKDGRQATKRVDHVKGHPKNPMSFDEVVDKFWQCVPHAARERNHEKMKAAVEMLRDLENATDVRELIGLLA